MSLRFLKLKQTGVYWPPSSGPDEFGRPIFGLGFGHAPFGQDGFGGDNGPIEVTCRWEDVIEEFIAPDGTRSVSKAKVFVNRDLLIGGLLFLGTLAEVEALGFPVHPKDANGVFDIRSFSKVPNLKAGDHVRTVHL